MSPSISPISLSYTQRVSGPDLMPRIFEESKERKFRHYFYGGSPDTLEKLNDKLKKRYPWLNIVGMYSPPYRSLTALEDEQLLHPPRSPSHGTGTKIKSSTYPQHNPIYLKLMFMHPLFCEEIMCVLQMCILQ